ncbi:hypothetical protein ACFSC4_20625 [Deinococcus malanensis]|uniref:hypothetical protein n=1 Tax=Deinococcus malanensis TaxID=1706855 RepID=UPI00363DBBF1
MLRDWHAGRATREQVIAALMELGAGSAVRDVLQTMVASPSGPCTGQAGPTGTDD